MLMGSHWGFFFPLERISSQTYCRECRVYFMITWASGPASQANGPKVILTSRAPLNRHISVSCLRVINGGETLAQKAGHFLTALLTQAFPLITFLANQHFVCLSKIPSGTGQALFGPLGPDETRATCYRFNRLLCKGSH